LKILFDQGTPVPLRKSLEGHSVSTAHEIGWSTLQNGELLNAAKNDSFDIFVTTDRNLKYQQNLESRKISIIVLSTTSWPRIRQVADDVAQAVKSSSEKSFVEIEIP
jgi:predicted nuclease of predicted toxin-antitoxin system